MIKYIIALLLLSATSLKSSEGFSEVYSGENGVFLSGTYKVYSDSLKLSKKKSKRQVLYIKESINRNKFRIKSTKKTNKKIKTKQKRKRKRVGKYSGKKMIKSIKANKLKSGMKLLDGEITYYKRSGNKKKEMRKSTFKLGTLHGQTEYYDKNHNIIRVECFNNGIPNGYFIDYNEFGEIISKDYFKNGNLMVKIK